MICCYYTLLWEKCQRPAAKPQAGFTGFKGFRGFRGEGGQPLRGWRLWPPAAAGCVEGGDGPLGRGLWYRPSGDEYEVSVTGYFFHTVIAFTTLLHNPQPSRKRRAEPLPAKGGRPPSCFREYSFPPQRYYITPSEPARSVGGTHRSVRQHMTDRTRAPKAPEPSYFREYMLRRQ